MKREKLNLVFVLNHDKTKVLLQKQNRGPFKGLWNGVGGKREPEDASNKAGAIRELWEETYLEASKEQLFKVATIKTHNKELHVYTLAVREDQPQQGEDEIINWFSIEDIMKEPAWLAGNGNIPWLINLCR